MVDETVLLREKIKTHILKTQSAADIFQLFHLLNYPKEIINPTETRRKKEVFNLKKEDEQRICEIFSILSFKDKFPIFLFEVKSIHPSFIRSVTKKITEQYLPPLLLIFTIDYQKIVFVFPSSEKREGAKQKLKITKLILEKDELNYTDIEILASLIFAEGSTWREVWRQWKVAFSVDRVTKEFFEDYKEIFFSMRDEVIRQIGSSRDAHEFTLQFLNRIMFLYFISKKDWLGNKKFVACLWNSYKMANKYGSNEFFSLWLQQIFLKAFNNRAHEVEGLPKEIKNELLQSPYLNGGLFHHTESDDLAISIPDSLIDNVLRFFEGYNFTIREDMPLDEEVAVDPQMIGYVYESLANVAEEIYDRNDLGIFYTPRVEVDFMCRRALVEYLANNLPEIPKEQIYHLVFDPQESQEKVETYFTAQRLWKQIEYALDSVSVVDPACGSGAFLVGMLNVLTDLYTLIQKHTKISQTAFKTKFRIIQRSLYGVDVMPWAIHAAELRLWLHLIVDEDRKREDLREHPLLPNLNLNLRIGDSLVQEIGGITLNVRTSNLDASLKRRLDALKLEKQKYYENSPSAKFSTIDEINNEELSLFEEIIDQASAILKNKVGKAEDIIKSERLTTKQTGLFGPVKGSTQTDLKTSKRKEECLSLIDSCNVEIKHLEAVKRLLNNKEKRPFVWDVDFAEVFGDKNGFDIVIGNPPYVRQEMISPPNRMKSEVSPDDRKTYKNDLIESVMAQYPAITSLDRKSDLYLYFYFHGLSLLNSRGTFCFITSNSWLDVDYGKELQEFLLKFVPIHAIYDNPKRSFEHADVNTIIALFGAPSLRTDETADTSMRLRENAEWKMIGHTAKFVMFKKPFEEAITSKNLISIDAVKVTSRGKGITDLVKNVVQTYDYRVFPVIQEDLLEEGWEYPEECDGTKGRFKAGRYVGDKWGGKYLRAPDIFYTILEKGKDKLVKLSDVAEVRFGIKTGANQFFYLDEEEQRKWKIEQDYLKPVLKSPRECKSVVINPEELKIKIFMCQKSKSELKGTFALKYIEWGESQGFHNRPSVSGRRYWWASPEESGNTFWGKELRERLAVFISINEIYADCRLYVATTSHSAQISLNSIISLLIDEIGARQLGGGGGPRSVMVYEVQSQLILNPCLIDKHPNSVIQNILLKFRKRELNSIFEECGFDPLRPIREQEPKPLPDRAELDSIIFEELGLNEEERKEVYWSICELVHQRLEKARSLGRKK